MPTMFTQPSVMLVFGLGTTGQSAVAFAIDGELIETSTFDESGCPQWHEDEVTVCDHRGAGGASSYAELVTAMNAAEGNYRLTTGEDPARVDDAQWQREVA